MVYSDSPGVLIGFIDSRPRNLCGRRFALPSVSARGSVAWGATVFVPELVGSSTRAHSVPRFFSGPHRAARECDRVFDWGQAAGVALDGSFFTWAIENGRDEDSGRGRVAAVPAGYLVILSLGETARWIATRSFPRRLAGFG